MLFDCISTQPIKKKTKKLILYSANQKKKKKNYFILYNILDSKPQWNTTNHYDTALSSVLLRHGAWLTMRKFYLS